MAKATSKRKLSDTDELTASELSSKSRKLKASSKPSKPKAKPIECLICAEDLPPNHFPSKDASTNNKPHDHRSTVCSTCWHSYLEAQIETKQPDQITCPQCDLALTEPEIKAHATEDTYQNYLTALLNTALQNDPSYRTCPSSTCSFGYILTQDDAQSDAIFNCRVCEAQYCIRCEVPMHSGLTCEEYKAEMNGEKRKKKDETASKEYLEKYAKTCPKCGVRIRKNGGCDHMTCSKCTHEFCWVCSAPYQGRKGINTIGNEAHDRTCHYHPRRLPEAPSMPYDVEADPGDEGWW